MSFGLAVYVFLLALMPAAIRAQAPGSEPPVAVPESAEKADVKTANRRALIVFYRPKRFFGSGLTPSIYVDRKQTARLDNGRFFSIYLEAGHHSFESSMKHAPLEIEIKPQETVYVEMVILAGNWRGGGRLIPAPAEDARATLKKLKPLDKQWVVDKEVVFDTERPDPRAEK